MKRSLLIRLNGLSRLNSFVGSAIGLLVRRFEFRRTFDIVLFPQLFPGFGVCLIPILEPEVDIHCPDKAEAERLLEAEIHEHLEGLDADRPIMLKLTIPDEDNLYADLIAHPKVLRVVALSGGYTRADANERLARNHGMVASFSRALVEDISAQQSDSEFNNTLDASIESIYQASNT